jgi:Transcription antiterminator
MGKKLLKTHKVDFTEDKLEMKWYVVVCQFNWERKAAENIQKRFESLGCADKFGEILVPIIEEEEINSKGRKVKKSRNLLVSGYIFIRMVLDNTTWNIVRQTTGVAGWLTRDGRPLPELDENVEKIKRILYPETKDKTEEVQFNGKVGDIITIKNYVFEGEQAKIENIDQNKKIVKATLIDKGFKVELNFENIVIV